VRRADPRLWVALAIVYTVWGSTYLAIRVAIETLPPMLMASVRFLIAGGILYAWSIRRGDRIDDRPGPRQWRAAAIVGTLLFLGGNGGVVWAEQRVPSGIAALLVASVPLWMALIAFAALKERLPRVAVAGLVVGFAGTALLIRPSGGEHVDLLGALVLVGASVSWAIGTLYASRAPLPSRSTLSAGMQLISGGVVLGVVGIAGGELARIHPDRFSRSSLLALAYLIVFGAVVAFSAYSYMVRNAPPSIVSTYAYVNPVIAVLLGWAILDEPIGRTTILAGAIIVVAVAMIVTSKVRGEGEPAAGAPPVEEPVGAEAG
jgi:drug/metabolite transporter (DMT)-like permease